MYPRHHLSRLPAILGLVGLLHSSASAQVASGPAAPRPEAEEVVRLSPFEVTGQNDQGYNSANTVGATRVNTAIKNTPISVVVVNQQFIQDIGATDPYYAARFVSGVSGAGSPNSGQMTLRGQNTQGATFRDGVPDVVNLQGATLVDMALTERIELIKGPAGTLYGSSNSGGIVNNVTKAPQAERRTVVTASIGSFNTYRAEFDTTGPVDGNRRLTYRVVMAQEDGETARGQVNKASVLGLMGQYQLAGGGSILVRYSYLNPKRGANGYNWMADKNGALSTFIPRTLSIPEKDVIRDNAENLIDVDASQPFETGAVRWTARTKLRYGEITGFNRIYEQGSNLYGFFDAAGFRFGDLTNSSFLDPRFSKVVISSRTRSERSDVLKAGYANFDLVGTSNFGEHTTNTLLLYGFGGETWNKTIGTAASYPGIDLSNPIYYSDPVARQGTISKNIDQTIKGTSYAYAFQNNLSLLDEKLILVLGARFDKATSTNLNRINNVFVRDDVRTGTSRKLGVVARPVEPVAVYYNYSETFSPNGFDQITGEKLPNQLPKNNEVGTKLNLLKDALVVNFAYFDTKTKNALLPVTVVDSSGATRLVNRPAGSLSVKGWESDATWAVNENVALLAGIGNLKSKTATGFLSRAVPQGLNYKVFGKYSFTKGTLKGVYAGFGFEHNSERALANSDTPLLPGYNTADLLLGYRRGQWGTQLNVSNLFDETYGMISVARQIIYSSDPRAFRISVNYRW
jgi:iron complex outermembrane receptor protein